MEVLYPCCAGLDVHKKNVVACRITQDGHGKPLTQIQTFSTMTPDLLRLCDWLLAGQVTQVALESTGVEQGYSVIATRGRNCPGERARCYLLPHAPPLVKFVALACPKRQSTSEN